MASTVRVEEPRLLPGCKRMPAGDRVALVREGVTAMDVEPSISSGAVATGIVADPASCCSGERVACHRNDNRTLRHMECRYEATVLEASRLGDSRVEGDAILGLGDVALRLNQPAKALSFYERALSIFKACGDRAGEGRGFCGCGNACRMLGRRTLDRPCYMMSLGMALAEGDAALEAEARTGIASVAVREGDVASALLEYQAAVAIHTRMGNVRARGLACSNLGGAQLVAGDPAAASKLYEEALQTALSLGNVTDAARACAQLANVHDRWCNHPVQAAEYRGKLLEIFESDMGRRAPDSCAICLEALNPKDPEAKGIVVLPTCLHMYHSECLGPWMEQKSCCPECRT